MNASLENELGPESASELSPHARILAPGVAPNPFGLLIDPQPALAAAQRAEALQLPRHAVYLFGKKGTTTNPEISRLDQDVELGGSEMEEEEEEEFA